MTRKFKAVASALMGSRFAVEATEKRIKVQGSELNLYIRETEAKGIWNIRYMVREKVRREFMLGVAHMTSAEITRYLLEGLR